MRFVELSETMHIKDLHRNLRKAPSRRLEKPRRRRFGYLSQGESIEKPD